MTRVKSTVGRCSLHLSRHLLKRKGGDSHLMDLATHVRAWSCNRYPLAVMISTRKNTACSVVRVTRSFQHLNSGQRSARVGLALHHCLDGRPLCRCRPPSLLNSH